MEYNKCSWRIFMFQKELKKENYNKREEKPVVVYNIGTGRKIAGFKNLYNNEFRECMEIKNNRDMDFFMDKYDISVVGIWTER